MTRHGSDAATPVSDAPPHTAPLETVSFWFGMCPLCSQPDYDHREVCPNEFQPSVRQPVMSADEDIGTAVIHRIIAAVVVLAVLAGVVVWWVR
jgi:hypothetical protein